MITVFEWLLKTRCDMTLTVWIVSWGIASLDLRRLQNIYVINTVLQIRQLASSSLTLRHFWQILWESVHFAHVIHWNKFWLKNQMIFTPKNIAIKENENTYNTLQLIFTISHVVLTMYCLWMKFNVNNFG